MDASILQSLLILSACIVVLFGISNYLKKINKNRIANLADFEGKIISRIPLMKNTFLYIVQIGNRTFLLGASDKSVTLISELKPSQTENNISDFPNPSYTNVPKKVKTIEELQNQPQNDLSFRSFLKSAFSKNN
mgnify:CR=1 FL=1